jgi:hypothetical protein
MSWLRKRIDRWLNCPLDYESAKRIANCTDPSPSIKVRCPTFIHRWWRKRQFKRAHVEATKNGETILGEWDDWLWINRKEIKAARRALSIKWSMEAIQDFKSEFP